MLNNKNVTIKNNFIIIISHIILFIGIVIPEEHEIIAVTTKAKGNVSHRAWDSKDYNNFGYLYRL